MKKTKVPSPPPVPISSFSDWKSWAEVSTFVKANVKFFNPINCPESLHRLSYHINNNDENFKKIFLYWLSNFISLC